MKKILLSCLLASVLGTFSGCASDEPRTATTSTTTTDETMVRPAPSTTTTTEQTEVPAGQ